MFRRSNVEMGNFVHDIEFSDDIKPKLEIKEEPIDVKSRFEEIVNPPYLVNGNFVTHSYETDTLMILQIKNEAQMNSDFIISMGLSQPYDVFEYCPVNI